ncbi:MAG: triose-phosphate isomerase [Gammaproteobacteria bacterium]|nr:triose-phosphate isomerase [Gammaproteobacteria bacterium]
MRTPLVAGNWKLNGSRSSIKSLVDGLLSGISEVDQTEVAVCPPFVYLNEVNQMLADSAIAMGSQDICAEDSGAFTGEVAGPMISEMGAVFAIIGHSERRSIYGESDELVARKFAAAQRHGLKPILCVGETLEEREKGVTEDVVARQIDAVINLMGVDALENAVIAYEPVWAIGTGMTATPEQAQDVHAFIRNRIAEKSGNVAEKIQILYGGSVKGANAAELFAKPDIDGGLIGGASLDADEFLTICKAGG